MSRIVASRKPLEKFFLAGEAFCLANWRRLLVTISILSGL